MTFGELASFIATRMNSDGDCKVEIPSSPSIWYSTAFGLEVARLLRAYSAETFLFFATQATLTLAEDDYEVDLLDSSVCSLPIFDPYAIYVDGNRLVPSDSEVKGLLPDGSIAKEIPFSFSKIDYGWIRLNSFCPEDMDEVPCLISGWREHLPIESDSTKVRGIPPHEVDLFSAYVEVSLRESAASDGVGFERLKRVDEGKYKLLVTKRSDNWRRVLGDVYYGG